MTNMLKHTPLRDQLLTLLCFWLVTSTAVGCCCCCTTISTTTTTTTELISVVRCAWFLVHHTNHTQARTPPALQLQLVRQSHKTHNHTTTSDFHNTPSSAQHNEQMHPTTTCHRQQQPPEGVTARFADAVRWEIMHHHTNPTLCSFPCFPTMPPQPNVVLPASPQPPQ